MDSDGSFQTISSVTAEFFPPDERKVVEVPFFDDEKKRDKAFFSALGGAKPNTCLELQAGTYPAFSTKRNIYVRAAIPGTVEIVAKPGHPAVVSTASCVRLEGIVIQPSPGENAAVAVRSGCVILNDCDIKGTVVAAGAGTRLYLAKCRISSSGDGLQVTGGATAAVETSAFINCATGAVAEDGSRLIIRHSRFYGCGRSVPDGGAVRALNGSFKCFGGRFVDNKKGVELYSCDEAALTACQFDTNDLGSVIADSGKTIKLYAVQFWGKLPGGPEHVQLSEVEAEDRHCTFNDKSLRTGIVSEKDLLTASSGPLDLRLQQLKQLAVSRQIREGLESILRNAQSAFQWMEQGLPIPLQLFHCVFEGEPDLGQRGVAAILANRLKELGFLSTSELIEVEMDDVMLGKRSVEDIAREAKGGAIFLQVSQFPNKREAHAFYTRTREILEAFISAAGRSSILILCGERESIRPALKKAELAEALGQHVVPFAPYAPGELLNVFITFCENHAILLTPRAMEKLLVTFYMLDDRRDNRFTTSATVRSLFEASEQLHRNRCAAQNDNKLPMDEQDLHLPLEQIVNHAMSAQPALISICPNCGAPSPWLPGPREAVSYCPNCDHRWQPEWGIWRESTFLRRLLHREDS